MSDIVQFLLARIAEDERLVKIAVASATVPTELSEADIFWRWGYAARNGFSSYVDGAPPTPPRVLAECKAKRELVELINGVDAAAFPSCRPVGPSSRALHAP